MLVLERDIDEVIVVGNDIRIMVVSVRGTKVKLGVEAPLDVPVDRLEVREAKERK